MRDESLFVIGSDVVPETLIPRPVFEEDIEAGGSFFGVVLVFGSTGLESGRGTWLGKMELRLGVDMVYYGFFIESKKGTIFISIQRDH